MSKHKRSDRRTMGEASQEFAQLAESAAAADQSALQCLRAHNLLKALSEEFVLMPKRGLSAGSLVPTSEELSVFAKQPIMGIKMYRTRTGSTLKDSKDALELAGGVRSTVLSSGGT